jgi:hypothetical protein
MPVSSWSVQFSPEAVDELQQAIAYYDAQKEGLGREFMSLFEIQIQQLILNPFTRSIRYLNVRLALIDRFPYAIHYVIKEDLKTIIVQTVLSTFKNPATYCKER